MFLTKVNGESLYWSAGRRAVFVTRKGRLVKTAGLPANLVETRYLSDDVLSIIVNESETLSGEGGAFRRLVDMTPPDRYDVMIGSTFVHAGRESIEISELRFDTELFVERCEAREMEWRFENHFWIGRKDGVVWRSVQHVHPSIPTIELQVLKPPAV